MRLNTKGLCPVSITCIFLHLSALSRDLSSSVHASQSTSSGTTQPCILIKKYEI